MVQVSIPTPTFPLFCLSPESFRLASIIYETHNQKIASVATPKTMYIQKGKRGGNLFSNSQERIDEWDLEKFYFFLRIKEHGLFKKYKQESLLLWYKRFNIS